jgi:hypothetical protein
MSPVHATHLHTETVCGAKLTQESLFVAYANVLSLLFPPSSQDCGKAVNPGPSTTPAIFFGFIRKFLYE